MRRLTLGVCILAVGTLLALPFRRPPGDVTDPAHSAAASGREQILDDQSLQLLVEEVTRDVEIPAAYDPQPDYDHSRPSGKTISLPLTYEDTAVPVLDDPLYQQRFNATVAIAARDLQSPAVAADSDAENDGRARRFNSKPAVAPNVAEMLGGPLRVRPISTSGPPTQAFSQSIPALPSPAAEQTPRAATTSQPAVNDHDAESSAGQSVLSPLPPPDESNSSTQQPRERHWIRQPD